MLDHYIRGDGVDVGCGFWKHRNCIGTDLAKRGEPVVAKYGYPSLADIQADAHKIPFRDGIFDFAISSMVLEHLEYPVESIRDMARVVRDGGLVCIVVPLGDHYDSFHKHIFGVQEVAQMAYSAGVGDIVQFDSLKNNYSVDLILQKRVKHTPPDTSIIIPVWNQHDHTVECLHHIEKYTPPSTYELIIIDNGSLDGAGDYARMHADKYLRNKYNRGCAVAWNQAINLAEGDYVAVVNSDLYVYHHWLDDLKECLAQPDVAFAFPSLLRPPYTEQHARELRDEWTAKNYFSGEAMGCLFMTRRATFDTVGLFDEQYRFGMFEDADMWRRIQSAGLRLMSTRKCWVHHVGNASWGRLYNHPEIYDENKRRYEA